MKKSIAVVLFVFSASFAAAGPFDFRGNAGNIISTTTLTAGRVPYASTGGLLVDSSGFTFNGSTLAVVANFTASSMTVVDTFISSTTAIPAASTTTLTWTEVTDRLNEFATSTFTVTLAGYYEVSVNADVSQTAGTGCLLIKNNNATIAGGVGCATGVTALLSVLNPRISRILNLAVNDKIAVAGSATTATATFTNASLTIKRVP